MSRCAFGLLAATSVLAAPAVSQNEPGRSMDHGPALNLTIGGYGLRLGNSAGVNELSINFRDDDEGIALGGVAVVSDRTVAGLASAAGAVVADDEIAGAAAAIGEVRGDAVYGIAVAGYRVKAVEVVALSAAIAYVRAEELTGMSVGAYNRFDDEQRGLAIGVFNYARELHGVQLGLLNYAGNNSGPFKLLPLLILHLN